jgi:hypothetical protein
MNAFQAIRDTIREEINIDQLPPFLDEAAELLSKAHLYYRGYKQMQINQNAARNPSKGHPGVYGAALHVVSDYTTIGAYAVNLALVTKCTEDLLREYRQLSEEYQRLCHTIDWQYPLYHPVEWKREAKNTQSLSPSLSLLWQVQIMGWVRQILKITRCALVVFWQMFKLSMCLCDAYLLLNGDSQTRYEACTELVAEWDSYRNQLKEDQKRLVRELEKGCDLADRILTRLGAERDSSFIIDRLKQKIEKFTGEAEEVLAGLYDRGIETLDMAYIKGKIAPLHIDLAESTAVAPALPYGRFPPWAGQAVVITPAKSSPLPLDSAIDFVLENVQLPCIATPMKRIIDLFRN